MHQSGRRSDLRVTDGTDVCAASALLRGDVAGAGRDQGRGGRGGAGYAR